MTFNIGDKVCFKLTLTNTGNTPITNIQLRDRLPNNLVFDSVTSPQTTNISYNPANFRIIVPDVPVGGLIEVIICGIAIKANTRNNRARAFTAQGNTPNQIVQYTVN